MNRRTFAALLLAATALGGPGCASFSGVAPRASIVMAAADGRPVAPEAGYRPLGAEYHAYLDAMFTELRSFCAPYVRDRKPCEVLLFAHGGMNSRSNTIARAIEFEDVIKKSGRYPIFLNWRSSFVSSWWDHLAKVQKGVYNSKFVPLMPYTFAADELRAIPEAPAAWTAELRHALKSSNSTVPIYRELLTDPQGLHLNDLSKDGKTLADDRSGFWERNRSWLMLPFTLPTKLIGPPLFIQPWGTGAWDVMVRRTVMLFRTEESYKGEMLPKAALAEFLDRFQAEIACQSGPGCIPNLKITLIGHSMGTIVENEILRYAPNLEIANIVYMAAAATLKDYHVTVPAYMAVHRDTQMYHLVLHPEAEKKERNFLDLSPRGSLLVWIDNYFTNPETPLDRTAGRFSNLTAELLITDSRLRPHMHFKVFRYGEGVACWNPQRHGDFGDFPFWDPNFWDPDVSTGKDAPYVRFKNAAGCPAPTSRKSAPAASRGSR